MLTECNLGLMFYTDFLKKYNNTIHRTINMKLIDVNINNKKNYCFK